jgi:hypothetical protein
MTRIVEFIDSILSFLVPYKDAIMGGAVYFIYSHVYLKRETVSNFLEFLMGVIFSVYASPEIVEHFSFLNISFVSFICGLMGMTIMRLALEFPWKETLNKIVSEILDTFAKSNNNNKEK